VTEAFGIIKSDGTIRAIFKPQPVVHGYLTYYHAQ
jgi:hypothetical protein